MFHDEITDNDPAKKSQKKGGDGYELILAVSVTRPRYSCHGRSRVAPHDFLETWCHEYVAGMFPFQTWSVRDTSLCYEKFLPLLLFSHFPAHS